jgi:protein gp37
MALIGTPWENGLPENIWLGVTVENQETADRRIPFLLKESAAVKFISVEPMLSNINIVRYISPRKIGVDFATRSAKYEHPINWVICGGESGPGARPLNPHWARSLRDQCVLSDVPFMFKQWGEWTPDRVPDYDDYEKVMMDGKYPGETEVMARVGIVRAGRTLDGIDWNERPGATCQAK